MALDAAAGRQGVFPGEGAQQGGFARPIDPHQADALPGAEPPREVVDKRATVGGVNAGILQLHHDAALALPRKRHELHLVPRRRHGGNQGLRRINPVAGLRCAGWRTAAQPRQLFPRQILPPLLHGIRLPGPLRPGEDPIVIAALVRIHLAVVHLPRAGRHGVQEPPVVRHHHNRKFAR